MSLREEKANAWSFSALSPQPCSPFLSTDKFSALHPLRPCFSRQGTRGAELHAGERSAAGRSRALPHRVSAPKQVRRSNAVRFLGLSSTDGQEGVKSLNFLVSPPASRPLRFQRVCSEVTAPPGTAEGAFEGEALCERTGEQAGDAGRPGCGCGPGGGMESPPPEPLGKPPAQHQRGLHLLRVSRDGSRLRPAGPRCSTAPGTASHPPPRFGTGSQPCQHLEGQSCPRPCVPAARLSWLPFPARPGPPRPPWCRYLAGRRTLCEPGRAGQVPAAGAGSCGSSPLSCARGLPGKLRVRSGGEGMSPELLPTFPPRPSFYHSISGPSHRHGPSFLLPSLRELDSLPPPASGSPAPSLRRPRPSVLAEQAGSAPRAPRGVRVPACVSPSPAPAVSGSQVSLCPAVGARRGGSQPAVAFCNRFLASPRESMCVPGEISATTAS